MVPILVSDYSGCCCDGRYLAPKAGPTCRSDWVTLKLSRLFLEWAFPSPLLFGGPVGTRRELTPLKENEEECGFYGLVIAHTLNA